MYIVYLTRSVDSHPLYLIELQAISYLACVLSTARCLRQPTAAISWLQNVVFITSISRIFGPTSLVLSSAAPANSCNQLITKCAISITKCFLPWTTSDKLTKFHMLSKSSCPRHLKTSLKKAHAPAMTNIGKLGSIFCHFITAAKPNPRFNGKIT